MPGGEERGGRGGGGKIYIIGWGPLCSQSNPFKGLGGGG